MVRRVQFVDSEEEYNPCSDCSSRDETFSGESTKETDQDAEMSRVSGFIMPGRDILCEESLPRRPSDRILSGESRNLKSKSEGDCTDSISSSDSSKSQPWANVS